jgi:ferredoxin
MTQLNFTVDQERCTGCGTCVGECVSHIIKKEGKSLPHIAPEQEADCLECQHCLAVCPTGAISIFGLNPEDSLELKADKLPSFEQEVRLIRGRRSVRQYRTGNVNPVLIRQILTAVANSPTGCNNRSLIFTVIDDEMVMKRFLEKIVDKIEAAQHEGRIPEPLAFLAEAADKYRQNHTDDIFRGAPHALIVSTRSDAPCPTEDVAIALTYFELLAQSAGLGTVWCGYLKFTLDAIPELKEVIGLPQDHVFYPIVFGYPAVRYARTIQRDNAATIRQVKL